MATPKPVTGEGNEVAQMISLNNENLFIPEA
jgi:hypothetical protein